MNFFVLYLCRFPLCDIYTWFCYIKMVQFFVVFDANMCEWNCIGKDASEEFEAVGHGSSARLMLDEYYVAEVDPSNKPIPKSAPLPVSVPVSVKATSSSSTIVKFLVFFFPLIILGFAISIRLYTSANSKPTHWMWRY